MHSAMQTYDSYNRSFQFFNHDRPPYSMNSCWFVPVYNSNVTPWLSLNE